MRDKKLSMFSGIIFLIKLFWKHQKSALFFLSAHCALGGVLPLASIIIPKYILDELLITRNISNLVFLISLLLLCILFGNTLLNFLNTQYFLRRLLCAQKAFRAIFYDMYLADLENIESSSFLETQKRAMKFLCDYSFGHVLQKFSILVSQVITLLGIISIISILNPIIVLAFIVLVLVTTWFNSKTKALNNKYELEGAEIDRRCGYLESVFYDRRFAKEIRINVLGDWLEKLLSGHTAKIYQLGKRSHYNNLKSQVFSNAASFIQQGIAYAYLVYSVLSGKFGIGSFTMFLSAINSFAGAMFSLMDNAVDIRRYSDYFDSMHEYLNIPRKQREGKNLPLKLNEPPVFEFRDVSFKYPNQNSYALKNINLKIKAGEKLSVVGENGAGKTTFIKLLLRLYRPTEGRILINGSDIQDFNFDDYVRIFSSVFQDFALYSMSLKDNVANGYEFEDDKIKEVLNKSGLKNKLDGLEKGIDTWVYRDFESSGFEPSGGEGQKIALARALLKDGLIMILDEPTAALDPRAEYEIYQNFHQMVQGKTAVFISHRLTSVKFCDRALVFKDGEIAESGSHEELMAKNGLYHELYTMQAQFYEQESQHEGH
jgi:ATP-binding cassette subfamily B protein/ATP-binding cassette subfamily C protein